MHVNLRKAALTVAGLAMMSAPIALSTTASAASSSSGSSGARPVHVAGVLTAVPTNRVHGVGFASVNLQGTTARVTVGVAGLLRDAPHAMHIHVKGQGECPQADDATLHNGHLAISTTDGLPAYGQIGASLTTRGDTSPASALAVDRFPSTGTFLYNRTFTVSQEVATAIRQDNAVIVVHGIDYNGNGTYDGYLGASELDPSLPQEATAPAICGALH